MGGFKCYLPGTVTVDLIPEQPLLPPGEDNVPCRGEDVHVLRGIFVTRDYQEVVEAPLGDLDRELKSISNNFAEL